MKPHGFFDYTINAYTAVRHCLKAGERWFGKERFEPLAIWLIIVDVGQHYRDDPPHRLV
jgi:hypothetical protein